MLDSLRKPLFVIAIVLFVLVVLAEVGSLAVLGQTQSELPRPGIGISYMAVLDGLVLFTIALIGVSLIVPERVHGRVQGIVTFFVSLLTLIGSILLIIVAVVMLTLMVSLLVAVPFGTIAYFAAFANFEVGNAAITLSFIMLLKLAFAVFLVLAHQRFLQNKGLVLLILTSLLANIIIAFLHGFVPGFLASITDAIAAIIVAILAAVWALFFFIGSIPSIIKVLRVDRALS